MRILRSTALLVLSAAGQQQPAKRVTFTANSQSGDCRRDGEGQVWQAIDSLTQNDFTVLEDGKPQKIAVFEFRNSVWSRRRLLHRRRSTT